MEIEEDNSTLKLLVFGSVGKGKSTLLNHLADGRNSNRFPSGSGFSSVTLNVTSYKGKIFGTNTNIELYDVPGLMGTDLTLEVWKNIIDTGFKGKFNGVLWVVSAKDRPGISDIIIRQGMEYILENFSEENIVLVLTHCDQWSPDPRNPDVKTIDSRKLGQSWIDALNQGLQKKVRLSHVLTFGTGKTAYYQPNYCEELAQLATRFSPKKLGIQKQIDYKGFGKQIMDSIDPKLEPAMKSMLEEQLKAMKEEVEQLRKQGSDNELLKAMLKANQDQTAALIAALNKPPVVIEKGGGCTIF